MATSWFGRASIALRAQFSGKSVERIYIERTFHTPRGISLALTNPLEVTPYYHHFYEDVEETYNDRFMSKHIWFDIAHIMENFDDIVHQAIEYLVMEVYLLRQSAPEVIERYPELGEFKVTDLKEFKHCDQIDEILEKANEYLLDELEAPVDGVCDLSKKGLTRMTAKLREYILANELRELNLSGNPLVKWPESFLCEKTKLERLSLADTRINCLPDDFLKDAPEMTHLSLANLPLQRLPKYCLYASKKIEQLDITGQENLRLPSHWPSKWLD